MGAVARALRFCAARVDRHRDVMNQCVWQHGAGRDASDVGAGGINSASVCEVGETRECVGRGACKGGQQCLTTGWSDCDCGSDSGGTAGTPSLGDGGTESTMAGAGNNGGGSNGGDGASAGATQGAAGEGSVEGVGGDGTTDWKADPCPEPLGLCSAGSLYNAWDCAGDCKAVCKGSCLVDKDSACSFKDGPGALGDLHGKEVPPYTTRRMAPPPMRGCARARAARQWSCGGWLAPGTATLRISGSIGLGTSGRQERTRARLPRVPNASTCRQKRPRFRRRWRTSHFKSGPMMRTPLPPT